MYAKIFKSIYYGSLAEEPRARDMMICICAHSDKTGWVDMTPKSVGLVLRMDDATARASYQTLVSPDEHSSSPAEDGRRILSRGYEVRGIQIVNYVEHRKIQDEEDRRAYNQQYYKEVTKPKRANESSDVNILQEVSGRSGEVEVEVDTEAEEEEKY